MIKEQWAVSAMLLQEGGEEDFGVYSVSGTIHFNRGRQDQEGK